MDISKFWVVAVISNPVRYKIRYRLYNHFEKQIKEAGANLLTVEMAFGDRPYEITTRENPNNVQLRSFFELWHKENMINIGISRLPHDWEYVAWIDADVLFQRPDWVSECVHQLQHYMVIQMFSEAIDLGPTYEVLDRHKGFVKSYIDNDFRLPPSLNDCYYPFKNNWHPGYAWAARREAIEHLGGLIDWSILGAGDAHMAWALVGDALRFIPAGMSNRYKRKVATWQQRSMKFIQKDIGYMPGTINHYWHGKKKDRKYAERWKILTENNFDPDLDLKRDPQGLWQLTDHNWRLRDEIRMYFRARNEDSIDVC